MVMAKACCISVTNNKIIGLLEFAFWTVAKCIPMLWLHPLALSHYRSIRMTRRWGRAERAVQLGAVVQQDDGTQLSCVVREVTSHLDRSSQMLAENRDVTLLISFSLTNKILFKV